MTPSMKVLIDEVLSLYYKVSLASLRFRLNFYHKCFGHNAKSQALKVKVSLMEYVGQAPDKPNHEDYKTHHRTNEPSPGGNHTSEVSKAADQQKSIGLDQQPEGNGGHEQASELTRYFKSHNVVHASLHERLRHSIWRHVNLAFLSMRRYDNNNAKLHIEIVNSALGQLEEYISEEEYCDLCAEIISRIDELKQVSKGVLVTQ